MVGARHNSNTRTDDADSTATVDATGAGTAGGSPRLGRDAVLEILSNRRRRFVVHHLKHEGGSVELGDLSERVAAWEASKPVDALDYRERKRVRNALRQFHLPKMDEEGFVEFDEDRGTVALSAAATERAFYVDVVPDRGVPWGAYYVGLAGLAVLLLGGVAADAGPLSALTPVGWCAFLAAALVVSSAAHFYDTRYRMRLGAREEPPGVG